ncbi:hypothetical protein M408DRAFT_334322 [Serendipita vermifera MAFF 305830]|uniref:Uncharacterized protein n=1 Tax=Serendipita vermifera MAFF 305830 TaxID=933852 RepID=A0A0C3AK17_SERVB|nr:hypothetical protein M408DRAFT_334322 [Serendipita vermifera MAFF 305830]
MHRKVDTITHLRFGDIYSLFALPMVHTLQLPIPAYQLPHALKQLEDQSTLPNLGTIEFIVDSSNTAPTDDWVKQHRPNLNLIISERKGTIILPGTIESWAPWPYYRDIFVTPPNVIYPP